MTAAALIAAAQGLDAAGFMPNKSGNLSIRTPDGFLITPSGTPYAALTPADLAHCTAQGATGRPSSEWRLHAAIYAARPDAQAVVHTHSPHATALSCARRPIPPIHYMITLAAAAEIPCAAHATFGTPELALAAVAALGSGRACLLANHGVLALGATLDGAVALAREVENLARQYLLLLAAGLPPVPLTEAELEAAAARLRGYGRPA